MIRELAGAAHRLDEFLRARIGRPYHVLLGVGLVVEIIKELREFGEVGASAGGVVGAALALLLFVALLIHQVGELHEHFERRRATGGDWRGRQ
jgi:hypothetical protein